LIIAEKVTEKATALENKILIIADKSTYIWPVCDSNSHLVNKE
jgi:hypothetical protein